MKTIMIQNHLIVVKKVVGVTEISTQVTNDELIFSFEVYFKGKNVLTIKKTIHLSILTNDVLHGVRYGTIRSSDLSFYKDMDAERNELIEAVKKLHQ